MSGPLGLRDLPAPQRRRAVARSAAQCVGIIAAMLAAYGVMPLQRDSGFAVAVRLVLSVVLVAGVLALEVRAVLRSGVPVLRAARALTTATMLFLVVFASVYVTMARADTHAFNTARLGRVDALYFTLTVLTTTGFGDIAAASTSARVVVSVQMALDLVLIGAGLRLVTGAARMRLKQPGGGPP